MKNNLRDIWSYQESISEKKILKERISFIPKLNCHIGTIGITGAKIFQLEIESSMKVHPNYLKKFQGLEIQVLPKDSTINEFTIILLEKELTDVFILFIEDITEKLTIAESTSEALNIIHQRVNYWKQLFARINGELLSIEKQRGLYGELCFLRLLLNSSSNKLTTLQCWQGTSGANQDFIRDLNAIEVKTSKAIHPSIHISNELQLDYTLLDHLFLCLITISESAGNSESLGSIIEELAESFNAFPDMLNEFDYRLDLAGIQRGMTEYYKETTYIIRNIRYFNVEDGFPVLITKTYSNPSIHQVSYKIDLSSCIPFEVSEVPVITTFLS